MMVVVIIVFVEGLVGVGLLVVYEMMAAAAAVVVVEVVMIVAAIYVVIASCPSVRVCARARLHNR